MKQVKTKIKTSDLLFIIGLVSLIVLLGAGLYNATGGQSIGTIVKRSL